MLGGLDRPTSGTVTVDGRELSTLKDEELTIFRRRKIGFVFQSFHLLPRQSALANVEMPLNYAKVPKKERRERALKALDRVGLSDRVDFRPNQLSGGQQQRVSIARALAGDPSLILADEPTGALDSRTSREVLNFLKELNEEGNTIVMITHDNSIALEAKHVVRVHDGKINFDGDVKDYAAIIQAGNEKHLEQ